jgi:hypothetical protein
MLGAGSELSMTADILLQMGSAAPVRSLLYATSGRDAAR